MFTILGSDGKEYGPVAVAKIQEWIAGGRANLETKARRSGEAEWKTLADFPEFNPTATPPLIAVAGPATFVAAPAVAAPTPKSVNHPPLAGLGSRFTSALIDGLLQCFCMIPLSGAMATLFREALQDPSHPLAPERVNAVVMAGYLKCLPYLGGLVAVQIALLCIRSQSIGKLLLGIQIFDIEEGQRAGPVRAFLLRSFIPTVIGFIPLLGFLFWIVDTCFIFRDDHRCVHDLLAGTKVVKK